MNRVLKSIVKRVEALPEEEQERAAQAFEKYLGEREASKLEAFRRDLDVGIEQAKNGQTVDGPEAFEKIKRRYAL